MNYHKFLIMKKEKKPTDDAAAGMNPKDRDFQRVEGDVDKVSASERNQSKIYEEDEASMNPKNRDFQREEDDMNHVSSSEKEIKQKDRERQKKENSHPAEGVSGREHSKHKNNPQPNHGGHSHSYDNGKRH